MRAPWADEGAGHGAGHLRVAGRTPPRRTPRLTAYEADPGGQPEGRRREDVRGVRSGPGNGGRGLRVLLVDYDPQGHLTSRMQIQSLPEGGESLLTHMLGEASKHLARSLVALPHERFGGRLHVLPASRDAFLMDAKLALLQVGRDTCLARALAPLEDSYDVIVLDGPPNLGLAIDLAINYVQRRPGSSSTTRGSSSRSGRTGPRSTHTRCSTRRSPRTRR
ncbi:ParA family protein [Streptomyces microflavus]|uniref:ParA family protein n=1 Tax=Streptomyces microflavus TaxID=1919 RepID=UPI003B222F3D